MKTNWQILTIILVPGTGTISSYDLVRSEKTTDKCEVRYGSIWTHFLPISHWNIFPTQDQLKQCSTLMQVHGTYLTKTVLSKLWKLWWLWSVWFFIVLCQNLLRAGKVAARAFLLQAITEVLLMLNQDTLHTRILKTDKRNLKSLAIPVFRIRKHNNADAGPPWAPFGSGSNG